MALIASKKYTVEISQHWYTKDGVPMYEVPNKSKPGECRPTTLRDARALGLVPSVTSILKVAAQPGLERWKQEQVLHAALTLPRLPGESEDAFASRVIDDSAEQARVAREKGSEIHAAIEQWLGSGLRPSDDLRPFVDAADDAMRETKPPLLLDQEKSFACQFGYGGKIDLSGPNYIADFKVKSQGWTDPKKLAYEEHGMQLIAYANGLGMSSPRLFNIFINGQDATYHVHEWPAAEHDRLWQMFLSLLRYWQLSNRYEP